MNKAICPKCKRVFERGNTVAIVDGKDACNYCFIILKEWKIKSLEDRNE